MGASKQEGEGGGGACEVLPMTKIGGGVTYFLLKGGGGGGTNSFEVVLTRELGI